MLDHKNQVILHMIGQVMDGGANRPIVTVGDVAKWLNCTRQNAHAKLRYLMDNGFVERVSEPYRTNTTRHRYQLTKSAHAEYKADAYRQHYKAYTMDLLPF